MPTIKTYRGRFVDLLAPTAEDIHPEELARLLARVHRFGGHTRQRITVAEHSINVGLRVAQLARADDLSLPERIELELAGLLHDAHEGYLGCDITRPLKEIIGEALKPVVDAWDRAIAARFGLDVTLFAHPLVKRADAELLVTEWRDQMGDVAELDPAQNWPAPLEGWTIVPEATAQLELVGHLQRLASATGRRFWAEAPA